MSHLNFRDHFAWVHNDDLNLYVNQTSLGSELITNGNFDSGTTGWGFGSGWSINFAPTYAKVASSTSGTELGQTMFVTAGDYYYLEFTIGVVTGSEWTIIVRCAGYEHKPISGTIPQESTGTYRVLFQAVNGGSFMTPNNLNFRAWTGSSTIAYIDSVSLKHVDTTDLFRGQWVNGEPWPIKGGYTGPSTDQSPWWVG